MIVATLQPQDETQRLKALYRYKILDTAPEATFDRIAKFATRSFGVPFAKLSFVDQQRSWIKSSYGIALRQIQRSTSIAAHTVELNQLWQIPDIQGSTLSNRLPLFFRVLGIRFFASAPIITPDGYTVGALSILDTMPHQLNNSSLALLSDLASIVTDELELRLGANFAKEEGERERLKPMGSHPVDVVMSSPIQLNSKANHTIQGLNNDMELALSVSYLDICSDRVEEAETLGASEKLYRQIVETQTELICRFKPDTTLTFVNTACCSYFERSWTELLGQSFASLFSAECWSSLERGLASLTEKHPSHTCESWVAKANGEVAWQQWKGQAIFNSFGELAEFQYVGRDITDQKQTIAQLQQKHADHLTLLSAIPDLILRVSQEGVCLDYQGSGNVKLSVPSSEWRGQRLLDIFPVEFTKPALDCLKLALKTQQTQVFEYRLLAETGYCYYEVRMIAKENNEVLAIVRDLTHLPLTTQQQSPSLPDSRNILQYPAQHLLQQYAVGVRTFQQAILSGQDLRGANLQDADFSDALFNGAELSGTNLQGANLSGANLRGAKLKGADLRNANLTFADLRGANFKGADLRYTNLSWVLLNSAKLTGAILVGAILPNGTVHP